MFYKQIAVFLAPVCVNASNFRPTVQQINKGFTVPQRRVPGRVETAFKQRSVFHVGKSDLQKV